MKIRAKYLFIISTLFACFSCNNKNESSVSASFDIIFEENTHYFEQIFKTYECTNLSGKYAPFVDDVWNLHKIHDKIFTANQTIDKEQLIQLHQEIYKLSKKYQSPIEGKPLREINDIYDNLLIVNAENTLLKQLEKKINCERWFKTSPESPR